MPKYKTQTNDLTEVIEAGGGGGLEVIEITDVPETTTSGTLNEAQMAIVNSDTSSCVKFNNEYYYKNDDNHTEGITVYTHTGYTETDGGSTIKYFSITLATSAWTLTTQNVSGKLYMHIINLFRTGTSIIKDDADNPLIATVCVYIICNSPTPLNTWDEYSSFMLKNVTESNVRLPSNYTSQYVGSQISVINSFNIITYKINNSLTAKVEYYTIGDTKLKSKEESIKADFDKNRISVIPLG